MSTLSVQQFAVGGYDENLSYLISSTDSNEFLFVDPTGDVSDILHAVEHAEGSIVGYVLTHTHFDHYEKLAELLEIAPAPVYVHELGLPAIASVASPHLVSVKEGSEIDLSGRSIEVLYTPGHSEDSMCLYIPPERAADNTPLLITGDTLFVGGCGRTNEMWVEQLYLSLERLKDFPPQTRVYPGHDYGQSHTSTIGEELTRNPYLLADSFETFKARRLG